MQKTAGFLRILAHCPQTCRTMSLPWVENHDEKKGLDAWIVQCALLKPKVSEVCTPGQSQMWLARKTFVLQSSIYLLGEIYDCVQVSHKKKPLLHSNFIGWLIGIFVLAYYKPDIAGIVWSPVQPRQSWFFHCSIKDLSIPTKWREIPPVPSVLILYACRLP